MRKRTRSSWQPSTLVYLDEPPGTTFFPITQSGWTGLIETTEDEPHPDYAARRKRGEIILGNFTRTTNERELRSNTMVFGKHPLWGSRTYSGDVCGYFTVDGTDPAFDAKIVQMRNFSIVEAYAKISKCNIMSGEILSDLGKTLSMLRKPFASVQDTILKIHKKRAWYMKTKSKTNDLKKATTNAWLEYRYGFAPAMMDAAEAMSLCERGQAPKKPVNLVMRAGCQGGSLKNVPVSATLPGTAVVSGMATFDRKCAVSAGVIFRVDNLNTFQGLGKSLGLRATDLPATLWETTPYSFVVDWFVGVGSWIQAITPDPQVTILGNWVTSVDKSLNSYKDLLGTLYVATTPATTYKAWATPSDTKSCTVKRLCNYPLPLTPVVNPDIGTLLQLTDGLALSAGGIISGLRKLKH